MLERTIARLKGATDEIEPPPGGFADRVAARIAERPPWSRPRPTSFAVIQLGRRALAAAAFVAAAALAGAWVADRELDRDAATLVDLAEFAP